MIDQCAQIKQALGLSFDIPFVVNGRIRDGDPWFEIAPEDDSQELFKLSVTYKNTTRVIINFIPEKYSASLIKDMSHASIEKKLLFTEYAGLLINDRFAHIDFLINGIKYDPCISESWPAEWNDLSCRITRSPVAGEDEDFSPADLTIDWAGIALGMFLSLMNVVPIDTEKSETIEGQLEGKTYQIISTRYERNPLNRKLCLALKGCICAICGFDFHAFYGDIGKGFIEVHHIEPVSTMCEARIIDPKIDLIPACSNCHSMIHRRKPPYLPEDILELMSKKQ